MLTRRSGHSAGVAYSFTLSAKSAEYKRSRWSRTFLVATDLNGEDSLSPSKSCLLSAGD